GDVIQLNGPLPGVDVKTEEKIISLWRDLRAEGKTMLVTTQSLGSFTSFCYYTVMVKGTVLASGPTDTTFTAENLELAFSGVLRHVTLNGSEESIITDDEHPFVAHRPSAVQREAR
ncbi:manganese/iron ABC transporter ATP-binding protein, partial [Escherichia coli]|nr:manganese/iron ABC transporter ATP-binding protein [Escherichia coli]